MKLKDLLPLLNEYNTFDLLDNKGNSLLGIMHKDELTSMTPYHNIDIIIITALDGYRLTIIINI